MTRTFLLALLVPAAGLACRPDGGLTKFNSTPAATIVVPADGSVVDAGSDVVFSGQVSDPDDDAGTLTATWSVDGAAICSGIATETGATTCSWVASGERVTVTLAVTDPGGATATDDIELVIAQDLPPEVSLTAPEDGATVTVGERLALAARVADDRDAPTELLLGWNVDGEAVELETDVDDLGEVQAWVDLDLGTHVIALDATDASGNLGSDAVEVEVVPADTAPSCGILSADGGSSQAGASVTFEGTVGDVEDTATALSVTWSSDRDGVLSTAPADTDGRTALTTSALSAGVHTIELEVTDTQGGTCADTIRWNVGTPPTVVIHSPSDGGVTLAGEVVLFEATVGDDATAPQALELSWASDLDGVLSTADADASGTTLFTADDLSLGAHLVTLTATDEVGLSTVAAVTLVVDGAPEAPVVHIEPDPATTADDLVVVFDAEAWDPDGDPVSYTYTWYRDGVLDGSHLGDRVDAASTTRGEQWTVEVTPDDGLFPGDRASASVEVVNSAPSLASVELGPDPAYEGDTLTCTPVGLADADGDSTSLSYAWYVNGLRTSSSGTTLGSASFGDDDEIWCTVTASDGSDAGAAVTSNVVLIGNTAPTGTTVSISPTDADTDTRLTAVAAADDADGDRLTWSYAWTVDGVPVGTDSSTLDGGWFVRGQRVQVQATPDDGDAEGPTATSAVVTIRNAAPSVLGTTISPAAPTVADTLSCAATVSDADGDTTSLSYTWEIDGRTIGVTTSTLAAGRATRGQGVRCAVSASDGSATGGPTWSSPVTIGNSAPTGTTVALSPRAPTVADGITASVSATDPDGDTISWTFQWYKNGRLITTATGASLSSGFARDDVIAVTVTPSDGTSSGATASDTVTVVNALPVLTTVNITPPNPVEATNILCVAGGAGDADGDTVSLTYDWLLNGVMLGYTRDQLDGSRFAKGDTVACVVTPSDGRDAGTPITSSTVTVQNSAPTGLTVSLSPSSPGTDDTLVATASATDDDGDGLSYSYQWYRDGRRLGETSDRLSGTTWFSKGQVISVTVGVSDGTSSVGGVSASVTIANSAPSAPVVEIQPADPVEQEDTLRCVVTTAATDPDGDSVSYTVSWTVDGVAFTDTTTTSLSGDTVPAAETWAGDDWACTVTASDGAASRSGTDETWIYGDPVDYAHIQYPCSVTAAARSTFDFYVWVYEPAVTQGAGQGLGIEVQGGVGAWGADAEADPELFTWTTASYYADKDGPYAGDLANDEYRVTARAPATAGSYSYVARVTSDGGLSWLYVDLGGDSCGLVGTTDGFEPTTAGPLTVY